MTAEFSGILISFPPLTSKPMFSDRTFQNVSAYLETDVLLLFDSTFPIPHPITLFHFPSCRLLSPFSPSLRHIWFLSHISLGSKTLLLSFFDFDPSIALLVRLCQVQLPENNLLAEFTANFVSFSASSLSDKREMAE